MKTFIKIMFFVITIFAVVIIIISMIGCSPVSATEQNKIDTKKVTETLTQKQKTPTDIEYSLERYNLIRRAYWVNGHREKANALVCEIEKPLGYVVLFSGNAAVGRFVVDGKVSSLNSYLSPDSEYYSRGDYTNPWLADVDGTYGENDTGIFFFTPDGKYIEWTGTYLYSDIPFEVNNPVVIYEGK